MAVNPRGIYLARHGETESNLVGLYAGRNTEPLTPAGRSQVSGLADTLGATGLAHVWTSSIDRALESAQLIGDRLDLAVTIDHRLDEMRLGPWEGRTEEEVARDFPDEYALWMTDPDQVRMDGRETLGQLATRVMDVVRDAASVEGAVLLMTHVAPIRVAILSALRCPLSAYKRVGVPNASCVKLDSVAKQAVWFPQGTSLLVDIERAGSVAA